MNVKSDKTAQMSAHNSRSRKPGQHDVAAVSEMLKPYDARLMRRYPVSFIFRSLPKPSVETINSGYTDSNSPEYWDSECGADPVNVGTVKFRKQGESMEQLDGVVRLLKAEHDRLSRQMQGISAALSAFGAAYGKPTRVRRKISAAGRARIAAAQRQRWAKLKGTSGQTNGAIAPPKKRTMSASGRKRIAAAQRARWAKVKAAQRKAA
jgi:hypothetical protein